MHFRKKKGKLVIHHCSHTATADHWNIYDPSYFPHIPFHRANMVDTAVAAHLVSPEFAALGSDVEPKMEEPRVPAHLFLLKSRLLRVRDRICGGDDAEPRWRNSGDGAHICFCSACSSVLRKRACRAGFTGEWTLCSPSQPAALLAPGQ